MAIHLTDVERPEHVLAITFTKKAAAEMRRRVLASLPQARAAELAHRLRIQTIDALCASLTRQMPVLARFGAQPRVVFHADKGKTAATRQMWDGSVKVNVAKRTISI